MSSFLISGLAKKNKSDKMVLPEIFINLISELVSTLVVSRIFIDISDKLEYNFVDI